MMIYEDLHRRYGSYIAKRVESELSGSEFRTANLETLTHYLEDRAELAHQRYKQVLDNPLASPSTAASDQQIELLYNLWHDAEDLAYVIVIAESIYGNLVTAKA